MSKFEEFLGERCELRASVPLELRHWLTKDEPPPEVSPCITRPMTAEERQRYGLPPLENKGRRKKKK